VARIDRSGIELVHEQYLAAVLSQEVSSREASGSLIRIKSAGFDSVKMLEDFNYDFQPTAPRDVIAHLSTDACLLEGINIVLLGPPGIGKTHLATGRRAGGESLRPRTPVSFRIGNPVGYPTHR